MEIEFKRNVGDSVWVITDNKVQLGNIERINFYNFVSPVDCRSVESGVKYRVKYGDFGCGHFEDDFDENQLFDTKEELIKSL